MPATTATHCPYCALQCGIHLTKGPAGLTVTGDATFPVNNGTLCVTGWSAPETLTHRDRLLTPLVRENGERGGPLVPATWDEALERVARRLLLGRREQAERCAVELAGCVAADQAVGQGVDRRADRGARRRGGSGRGR